ncbi:MAG: cytidylate kinase-like family protein [Clostridia bacterium]|nr:cytidylate kinase-like family protein [Clostridia bacterium]
MSQYVITINRSFGSGGKTVGKLLSSRLAIPYYDRDLIRLASEESGINVKLFGQVDEVGRVSLFKRYGREYGRTIIPPGSDEFTSNDNLFNIQAKIIRELAEQQSCIIVGRCADHILEGASRLLRVFVHAPLDFRVHEVETHYGLSRRDALREIEKIDRARAQYYRYYTGKDWNDARNYDLCLNSASLGFDRTAEAIIAHLNVRLS